MGLKNRSFIRQLNPGKRWSGNGLGNIFLPFLFASLPDRSQDIIRAYKTLVKLHVEEPGFLVIFHPHDPRNGFDFGAHGVGTARSNKAAPFFHAVNLDGDLGRKILFGHGISSLISPGLTTQCPGGL